MRNLVVLSAESRIITQPNASAAARLGKKRKKTIFGLKTQHKNLLFSTP
jgi:hypothetical protein